jgi:hypothetical protein
MQGSVAEELAGIVRRAERSGAGDDCAGPTMKSATTDIRASPLPGGPTEDAVVLADRPDGTVVRIGPVVSKAHALGTDLGELTVRLRVATHPRLDGILLPPLPLPAKGRLLDALHDGRPVTLWPYGTPVSPDDPDAAPWEQAAALLAALHAVPPAALPGPLPAMRGPAKVARAVARLRRAAPSAAVGTVLRACALLPAHARGEAAPSRVGGALCHGDLHLGQLVRLPASPPRSRAADTGPGGRWLLIDVDDLGLGDPAWDLARPAAWYAAGLLAPELWARFLGAYRAAHGPAVPSAGDPWPRLDTPARALTVQTAALALAKADAQGRAPDEVEEAVIDACARMVRLPHERAPDGAP